MKSHRRRQGKEAEGTSSSVKSSIVPGSLSALERFTSGMEYHAFAAFLSYTSQTDLLPYTCKVLYTRTRVTLFLKRNAMNFT